LFVSPALFGASEAEPAVDPWRALEELRLHLAASGDLAAPFTQTYVPAGFATGDEEQGKLTLALPDCLRWDYAEPYPKSYLLCGSRLHTWVQGEPQGQRLAVVPEEQPGLDLLLLSSAELRKRYSARGRAAAQGRIEVVLTPKAAESRLADVSFELDRATQRPTAIAYSDRDGNRTRFRFGDFRLIDDPAIFTPPPTLEWREP
jgi:outer membrane lipoprotein carrier protein